MNIASRMWTFTDYTVLTSIRGILECIIREWRHEIITFSLYIQSVATVLFNLNSVLNTFNRIVCLSQLIFNCLVRRYFNHMNVLFTIVPVLVWSLIRYSIMMISDVHEMVFSKLMDHSKLLGTFCACLHPVW